MLASIPSAVLADRFSKRTTLIVSMGTIGATAERVVDKLRAQGQRVGSLRVRLFRPLPSEAIKDWFAGRKRIAVIDRDISLGFGGVLWGEIRGPGFGRWSRPRTPRRSPRPC
jgi:pyruvate/2-oxoacid:ferredoxin oxidoreductase alpha subunit